MTTIEKIEKITKAMCEIRSLLGNDAITATVSSYGTGSVYLQLNDCIEWSGLNYTVERWEHDPKMNALRSNLNGINIIQLNER